MGSTLFVWRPGSRNRFLERAAEIERWVNGGRQLVAVGVLLLLRTIHRKGGEPDGATNSATRSQTNQTTSASGSRR